MVWVGILGGQGNCAISRETADSYRAMVTDRFVRTCSNNSTYFYNLFETLHDGQLRHNGHTSASQLRSL